MALKQEQIFKQGSTTYFTSSLFFPPSVRRDVTRLYAFVRVADDYVDVLPQRANDFYAFRKQYEKARDTFNLADSSWKSGNLIIDDFVLLSHEKGFKNEWVTAFLDAMEADLTKTRYTSLEELEKYIYGSAEVIGLIMCKILNIPEIAYDAAMSLGKAMQYCNFLRDLKEDLTLGRQYIPISALKSVGLTTLKQEETSRCEAEFISLYNQDINRFSQWQKDAEQGFKFIPRKYRIAIKTASDMYKWTASQISKNPFIVYEKKVKPSKAFIILRAIYNSFTA